MKLGFFTMPIHPLDKDWRLSLKEDREAFLLADELGFTEAYVGEHVTDKAENITSSIAFIAWIAAATKQIRLGTGTINMPNTHPPALAASIAMLDHMVEQLLLALEIVVEHAVVALGRLADAINAGAAIAFARELRDRRAQ